METEESERERETKLEGWRDQERARRREIRRGTETEREGRKRSQTWNRDRRK